MRNRQPNLLYRTCLFGCVLSLSACASVDKRAASEADAYAWNIEVALSRALRVPVFVGSARLTQREGLQQLELRNVVLENPPQFAMLRFLEVPRVVVTMDPSGPGDRGPIFVRSVTLEAPQMIYEWTKQGSNLDVLQYWLEAYLRDGPFPNERTLIIEQLEIKGTEVSLADIWLQGELVSFDIPALTLSELGTAEAGLAPRQLIYRVFSELQARANDAIAGFQAELREQRESVLTELKRTDWEFKQFFSK